MKRVFLSLLATLLTMSVSAQSAVSQGDSATTVNIQSPTPKYGKSKSVVQTEEYTVITTTKIAPNFSPKHEVRVGVGALSVSSVFLLDTGSYDDIVDSNFRQDMENSDTYLSPRTFIGNYTLSYTYHDRRWLQYGATVGFGASTCWRKEAASHKTVENLSIYSLSVMPTVRFVWFYRPAVQLYSSVSVCLATDFEEAYLWYDTTLVGCSFGRKLFGFVELGGGITGSARVGLGYRFDAKTKK